MCAGDVQKDVGLDLFFVEPMLHQIADADETDEPSVFHDRQMADAVGRHDRHHGVDAVIGRAGGDIRGHEFVNFMIEGLGTVLGQGVDHVAFGEHPGEAAPTVGHDERADTLVVQQMDGFSDTVGERIVVTWLPLRARSAETLIS